MNRLSGWDRFLRFLLGIVALLAAVFWLGGLGQLLAYAVAGLLLTTALLNACPVYRLLGRQTCEVPGAPAKPARRWTVAAALVLLGLAVGGSYASVFFTRKAFLADFNAMNHEYKQTLFLTGKAQREQALAHYERLLPAYAEFRAQYSAWQPWVLRGDGLLPADLARVDALLRGVGEQVRSGDLQQAHLALEGVRSVFNQIFKRNGLSLLSVALVDFHDAMELMLDAGNARDAARLQALYPQVDAKMQAMEAEAGDADIQAIRQNLDALLKAAQDGQTDALPPRAEALKSSFVKVYLQRG